MSKTQKQHKRRAARERQKQAKETPRTQRELATILGVSPAALNYHVRKGDAPPLDDIPAWEAFLGANGREGSLPEELRRKIGEQRHKLLAASARREEIRLAKEEGETLDRATTASVIASAMAMIFDTLDRAFGNELPATLAGAGPQEIGAKLTAILAGAKEGMRRSFSPLGVDTASADLTIFTAPEIKVCTDRARSEGVSDLWARFQQFRFNVESATRTNREGWLELRMAAGLPVYDATQEELAKFPGLKNRD